MIKPITRRGRKGVPIAQVAKTLASCEQLFFALGDRGRQEIVMLLAATDELNVSQITDRMTLSRPAVSHHLRILRQAGLIAVRREGTENFHALAIDAGLALLARFIDEVENCEP